MRMSRKIYIEKWVRIPNLTTEVEDLDQLIKLAVEEEAKRIYSKISKALNPQPPKDK